MRFLTPLMVPTPPPPSSSVQQTCHTNRSIWVILAWATLLSLPQATATVTTTPRRLRRRALLSPMDEGMEEGRRMVLPILRKGEEDIQPQMLAKRRRLEESLEVLYVKDEEEEEEYQHDGNNQGDSVVDDGENVELDPYDENEVDDGGGDVDMEQEPYEDYNKAEEETVAVQRPQDVPPAVAEKTEMPEQTPSAEAEDSMTTPSPQAMPASSSGGSSSSTTSMAQREVEDPLFEEEGPSTMLLDSISLNLLAQRILGIIAAFLGMIWTAYQVAENPDGLYASLCRGIISILRCACRMITCRCRGAAHRHIPISTMEYGFPVGGTSSDETVNFK